MIDSFFLWNDYIDCGTNSLGDAAKSKNMFGCATLSIVLDAK